MVGFHLLIGFTSKNNWESDFSFLSVYVVNFMSGKISVVWYLLQEPVI